MKRMFAIEAANLTDQHKLEKDKADKQLASNRKSFDLQMKRVLIAAIEGQSSLTIDKHLANARQLKSLGYLIYHIDIAAKDKYLRDSESNKRQIERNRASKWKDGKKALQLKINLLEKELFHKLGEESRFSRSDVEKIVSRFREKIIDYQTQIFDDGSPNDLYDLLFDASYSAYSPIPRLKLLVGELQNSLHKYEYIYGDNEDYCETACHHDDEDDEDNDDNEEEIFLSKFISRQFISDKFPEVITVEFGKEAYEIKWAGFDKSDIAYIEEIEENDLDEAYVISAPAMSYLSSDSGQFFLNAIECRIKEASADFERSITLEFNKVENNWECNINGLFLCHAPPPRLSFRIYEALKFKVVRNELGINHWEVTIKW